MGVELVGAELFGSKTPASAKHRDDLQPNPERVTAELAKDELWRRAVSHRDGQFFDPVRGEELVDLIDSHKSFCGLTYNMDHAQIEILCELLSNYQAGRCPRATKNTTDNIFPMTEAP